MDRVIFEVESPYNYEDNKFIDIVLDGQATKIQFGQGYTILYKMPLSLNTISELIAALAKAIPGLVDDLVADVKSQLDSNYD